MTFLQTVYLARNRQVEAADLHPLSARPGAEAGVQCDNGAILMGGNTSRSFRKLETWFGQVRSYCCIFETCTHKDKIAFHIRLQSEA